MFGLLRKKQKDESKVEEPIHEEKINYGQVTVILNGEIFDNFINDNNHSPTDINLWKWGNKIIIPPFSKIDMDISSIDYHLSVDVTETFTKDHEHVVLHCTVPAYLFREIMDLENQ